MTKPSPAWEEGMKSIRSVKDDPRSNADDAERMRLAKEFYMSNQDEVNKLLGITGPNGSFGPNRTMISSLNGKEGLQADDIGGLLVALANKNQGVSVSLTDDVVAEARRVIKDSCGCKVQR